MYLLMYFSVSQVFLEHFSAAETQGEECIYLFDKLFFFKCCRKSLQSLTEVTSNADLTIQNIKLKCYFINK